MTTLILLKEVSKLVHYFCKCLAFPCFVFFSCLSHSLKSFFYNWFRINKTIKNCHDNFFVRFVRPIIQKNNLMICFIAQRNRGCQNLVISPRGHMHSERGCMTKLSSISTCPERYGNTSLHFYILNQTKIFLDMFENRGRMKWIPGIFRRGQSEATTLTRIWYQIGYGCFKSPMCIMGSQTS